MPTLRDDSPQAWHSFTVADQVDLLVSAREADADLGFHGANDGALLPAPKATPNDGRCGGGRGNT